MKREYKDELKDAFSYALKIRRMFKSWEKTKNHHKHPEKGVAYKNFLLIYCYGKIEFYFKQIISDYFVRPCMPERCISFGNKIRERLPGSMTKGMLNEWIKKECSTKWFDEIDYRCKDPSNKCKRNKNYKFNDMYLALTSLTNLRHDLAHGTKLYLGNPDDLIDYFKKSIIWLYEIDDIINKMG